MQRLLNAATATNSAPSGAAAGISTKNLADDISLKVYSTAGSGTMTVTLALWGYNETLAKWFRLGLLNGGSAIGETSSDAINYAEPASRIKDYQRIYLEITAIGGSSTAITAYAYSGRPS